ncbi:hypothetical protein NMY22_g16981 [Coprinellus aureogranulatus]|nr:hypothetical protein NMY22_g16981 [Coprinellus aureogranulatus]
MPIPFKSILSNLFKRSPLTRAKRDYEGDKEGHIHASSSCEIRVSPKPGQCKVSSQEPGQCEVTSPEPKNEVYYETHHHPHSPSVISAIPERPHRKPSSVISPIPEQSLQPLQPLQPLRRPESRERALQTKKTDQAERISRRERTWGTLKAGMSALGLRIGTQRVLEVDVLPLTSGAVVGGVAEVGQRVVKAPPPPRPRRSSKRKVRLRKNSALEWMPSISFVQETHIHLDVGTFSLPLLSFLLSYPPPLPFI